MRISLILLWCSFFCRVHTALAQPSVTRSIRDFGAKGDGKKNDTEAFQKAAAFFNNRQGNGKLLIPAGTYIVGRQVYSKGDSSRNVYTGDNILHLKNCRNLVVEASGKVTIRYAAGLKLGAFSPRDGKAYRHNKADFLNPAYAAIIGYCIFIEQCSNVTVSGLRLDGNNKLIEFGGRYNDLGIQLQHYGFFIYNSRRIVLKNVYAGYFGLDGISVNNRVTPQQDSIFIENGVFEYNSRQGLSWVRGNGLTARNCQFNHTGKSKYSSAPGAGVDIEAEDGTVSGGRFYNCSFVNNTGCGLVTVGDVSDCSFEGCTFWGTTNWSAWVTAPSFLFRNCNFHGAFVHGFNASTDKEATRFERCLFEDKPYNKVPPYGGFLIEADGKKRLFFDNCTLVANTKKLGWLTQPNLQTAADKIIMQHCSLRVKSAAWPENDFVMILRGVRFVNNTIQFDDATAEKKGYWRVSVAELANDCTGNTVRYGKQ